MKITIKNKDWELIKTLDAKVGQTLLKQITESWVEIHNACQIWICAACMCQIEKWEEFLNKSFRTEPWFPLWDDEIMTCIAWLSKEVNPEMEGEIILKTIY